MSASRFRRVPAPIVAVLLAVLVAACGTSASTSEDSADSSSSSSSSSASSTATGSVPAEDTESVFPVTIEHQFGETVVPSEPERVVSVGFNDQDDLLALGVVPVGIRDWYGEQPFAVWPWAVEALGDAEPAVLSPAELDFEAIAALDPDLIVGVSSGMTDQDYGLLSAIAPTVAQSADFVAYGTPWQDRALRIGAAIGRLDEAEQQVDAIEARLADIRAEHPSFDGASAAVAFAFDGQPGAYASEDGRARLLADMGFVTPEVYDEIAGDQFYASFSAEQTDLLDTDVIVWVTAGPEDDAAIRDMALRDTLTAVREGREVFLDTETAGAFSFGSLLSLPALLDSLVPQLEAAVDGDPATEVPPSAFAESSSDAAAVDDEEAGAETAEPVTFEDDDQAAAASAWSLVFDSTAPAAEKGAHLEDADAVGGTLEAYASAGDAVGGIAMHPTAVVVDGDTAEITYDVLFGGSPAYRGQTGTLGRADGVWQVPTTELCTFMASARVPCEQ
ncbi:iron-siderophore ABC transporter substrate-binding protein [Euzebya pacifica]|uniref:iron-siderophore ABC transporter substrate-binding protein n=1 Tax=Euzebya pacifica TaxID=1608957 RepID=UPI000DF86525|nr:iron-siderophore ABC transporter substrate-binding protein [Euzebya pacifica]